MLQHNELEFLYLLTSEYYNREWVVESAAFPYSCLFEEEDWQNKAKVGGLVKLLLYPGLVDIDIPKYDCLNLAILVIWQDHHAIPFFGIGWDALRSGIGFLFFNPSNLVSHQPCYMAVSSRYSLFGMGWDPLGSGMDCIAGKTEAQDWLSLFCKSLRTSLASPHVFEVPV
ncbi:hypothetical protein RIF29_40581 [Crotalaria pallida]|uniref:Uncharacterized protein n=1 Tax=Crotalaria pallida TaxID=3830 RepID=A0AAN9HRT5_CROPI